MALDQNSLGLEKLNERGDRLFILQTFVYLRRPFNDGLGVLDELPKMFWCPDNPRPPHRFGIVPKTFDSPGLLSEYCVQDWTNSILGVRSNLMTLRTLLNEHNLPGRQSTVSTSGDHSRTQCG